MNNYKLDQLSDEELMIYYQNGDFRAFEVLYTRHSGRIFEYLKRRVAKEAAQDILQEVFAKVHKSRDKYNSQYPFLPWVFTITRNTLFDFLKLSETRLANKSDSNPELLSDLASPNSVLGSETQDLSNILTNLPHLQKRAIELRYLQEWSFEKIAEDLKTSEENARQLISRGVKKIRSTLANQGERK
jgi:RNA polymerase sigma-70 factor (ECF subfamily)